MINFPRQNWTDYRGKVKVNSVKLIGSVCLSFIIFANILSNSCNKGKTIMCTDQTTGGTGFTDERFKQLIKNSFDMIVLLDSDGNQHYVSDSCERILGYKPEELINIYVIEQMVHPEDQAQVRAGLTDILEGSTHGGAQYRHRHKNGSWVYLEAFGTNQINNPLIKSVVLNVRDVTESIKDKELILKSKQKLKMHRDHLEELVLERTFELAQSRDKAEAANRAKSVFLTTMSHELRTPLNGVMGMTDLALSRATDTQQIDWLSKSQSSANHLLNVLNDILNLAKIEADLLTLEESDFDLAQTINDSLKVQSAAAEVKGLRLSCEIDAALPGLLYGDASRLKQILLNYIGNAVKFSERGHVIVRAHALEQDQHNVLLKLEVCDEGIGISPEQISRLFRPFVQVDDALTRKYGGSGLGLVTSKRIAMLMGGDAGVESTMGVGSIFWVTVRLRKQQATANRAQPRVTGEATAGIRTAHSGG